MDQLKRDEESLRFITINNKINDDLEETLDQSDQQIKSGTVEHMVQEIAKDSQSLESSFNAYHEGAGEDKDQHQNRGSDTLYNTVYLNLEGTSDK